MGAPISSIFSEVYLESLQNKEVYYLLIKHNVTGYFRYVDDVLIIYDRSKPNIHDILDDFNKLAAELKFTLEKETNREINYLDITIQRKQHNSSISIYRKLTIMDTIIPNDSCHPREH